MKKWIFLSGWAICGAELILVGWFYWKHTKLIPDLKDAKWRIPLSHE